MIKRACPKCTASAQVGFTLIEFIIALIILSIVAIYWLQVGVTGVKNGTFVTKLDNVKYASSTKAVEIIKRTDLTTLIPQGQQSVGSIAPDPPVFPYYADELNENGWLIQTDPNTKQQYLIDPLGQAHTNVTAVELVPKFTRQWTIIKDQPNKDEMTVIVTVVYHDSNQIVRVAKEVKVDGFSLTSGPTP